MSKSVEGGCSDMEEGLGVVGGVDKDAEGDSVRQRQSSTSTSGTQLHLKDMRDSHSPAMILTVFVS